jgi:PAS domain S-box-containing protein
MIATQTFPRSLVRTPPSAAPAPTPPAPARPDTFLASPRASATAEPARLRLDAAVAPPPSHLAGRAGAERSREWRARVVLASVLVLSACAAAWLAPHARTLAGPAPGSYLLAACATTVGAAALEGWRRARKSGAEAAALQVALRVARESEHWYQAVVDNVVDAMLVASPEGRLVEVNRAATVLLGREREWLMGRRLWDLLPLDERLVALRRGDVAATRGGGLRRMLQPDGSEVLADVSWYTHDDGRVVYLARRFSRW